MANSSRNLREISSLPDQALISVPECAAFEAVSVATIWRRIKRGTYAPIRTGGTCRLEIGDVRAARKGETR